MPQNDHPGFEFWDVTDLNHPFPVGPIVLGTSNEDGGSASANIMLPPAIPKPRSVAERSIGMARSAKLWFALRCTRDPQGAIACEAVLRGQHLNFFPDHGESDVGPLLEVRLSAADMRGAGSRLAVEAHGDHCDAFLISWGSLQGTVHCTLSVWHNKMTPDQLRRAQEKAERDAYYTPPQPKRNEPLPEIPLPTPTPAPDPGPGPDGT